MSVARNPLVSLLAVLCAAAGAAQAAHHRLTPADDIQAVLEEAREGDVVELAPGTYRMRLVVREAITLTGPGAVIDAGGRGSAVTVRWPGATIEHLTIRNYGSDLYKRDSGVRVTDGADGVVLRHLDIAGPGFGIRADRLGGIRIENCRITGDARKYVLDRGDGIYFNYVRNPELAGNIVRDVRDGFYFENVRASRSHENAISGGQYGIHYMYTQDDSARDNFTSATLGGYALMSSKRVRLEGNTAVDSVEFGILMNVCEACTVAGNRVLRVHNPKGRAELDTEGKGLFIYGPGSGTVRGNRFEAADIGVGVAMGGEGVQVDGNAFAGNRTQVRYVGRIPLEWSRDGRGNFWSTHLGWDLDGDGTAERPYQPNDSLDRLFWIYPEARFLMDSPVVGLLRWLAAQFEIDRGKGVVDSHPLMRQPEVAGARGRFAQGVADDGEGRP